MVETLLSFVLQNSGIIGALLVVCAWSFEAFESIEHHRGLSDIKFAIIYLVAMSLLILHSAAIDDTVFIFLNTSILAIVAFEFSYTIYIHKLKKKKRKKMLKSTKGK